MLGLLNESTLADIGNALREKTASMQIYRVDEMASIIDGFRGGVDSKNYNALIDKTIVNAYSDAIPHIGSFAFYECHELQSVCFPNAEICYTQCFADCTKLMYVDLPKVKLIEPQVFHGDTLLMSVTFTNPGLEIQTQAFGHCANLYTVDLTDPYKIWGEAFYECSNLQTVIIRYTGAMADIPILSYPAFQGTPIEAGYGYIYVPRDLITTYQATSYWSQYANQFRAIEDYGY